MNFGIILKAVVEFVMQILLYDNCSKSCVIIKQQDISL